MSPTMNFSPRVTSIEVPPREDVPLVVVTVACEYGFAPPHTCILSELPKSPAYLAA